MIKMAYTRHGEIIIKNQEQETRFASKMKAIYRTTRNLFISPYLKTLDKYYALRVIFCTSSFILYLFLSFLFLFPPSPSDSLPSPTGVSPYGLRKSLPSPLFYGSSSLPPLPFLSILSLSSFNLKRLEILLLLLYY